ncbi:hypothetical protein Aduo_001717 [Ancylostoma duodenale]
MGRFLLRTLGCFLFWHKIELEHINGYLVFFFGDFGGGAGDVVFDDALAMPGPPMPMMAVSAFSDSGAAPPVKIRTEFPESWIVVSFNTEYVEC